MKNVSTEGSDLDFIINLREAGRFREAVDLLSERIKMGSQDVTTYALMTHILLLDKREDEAEEILEHARRVAPTDPAVLRNHAWIQLKKQNFSEALDAAAQAYEAAPYDAENCLVKAVALSADKRDHEALPFVVQAVEIRPNYAEAYAHRALIRLRKGDTSEAASDVSKALKLKPHLNPLWGLLGRIHQQRGNFEASINAMYEAISREPNNPDHHIALCTVLQMSKDMENALKVITHAVSVFPKYLGIRIAHANLLASLQHTEDASIAYKDILSLAPGHPDALLGLGLLAKQRAAYSEALELVEAALKVAQNHSRALHEKVLILIQLNQYANAEREALRQLNLSPSKTESTRTLAKSIFDHGQHAKAKKLLYSTLERFPDDTALLEHLSTLHAIDKEWSETESLLHRICVLSPPTSVRTCQMADAIQRQGRTDEAYDLLIQAYKINKNDVTLLQGLANLQALQGNWAEARSWIQRALTIEPKNAALLRQQGVIVFEQGRTEEAGEYLHEAIELAPDDIDTLKALIRHYKLQRAWADAEHWTRRAIKQSSTDFSLKIQLSALLDEQQQFEESLLILKTALDASPNNPDCLRALANHHIKNERWSEAREFVQRAISIAPYDANAHALLGILLEKDHQLDAAAESYGRACEYGPNETEHLWRQAFLLPRIPASASEIERFRNRYRENIARLHHTKLPIAIHDDKISPSFSFYLAYHNVDDRADLEALTHLYRAKTPSLDFVAPHVEDWTTPAGNRRIRLGICSEYLVGHTIGKLYQGLIRNLDRTKFEITLIHAPEAKTDLVRHEINKFADRTINLKGGLAQQWLDISELKLDLLFYPDIGMSHSTGLLAHSRLAPIQFVSWGHPNTTGLNTIDYFISSSSIEPDNADQYYSERLIKLSRLPCYYEPFLAPIHVETRSALGLPTSGTLYGCPQSLFKLHPDFDPILAEISYGDPTARLVFLDGTEPSWQRVLRQRWRSSFPIIEERAIFLDRMPMEKFMALLARLDVLLDPIHFGSGNTLYEAMVYGKPIITWPGRFMRGRIVAGAYRQMDIQDPPIAKRLEDYATLALSYGRDPIKRKFFQDQCKEGVRALYADMKSVREFEYFIEAALTAANEGSLLPVGWSPAAASNI